MNGALMNWNPPNPQLLGNFNPVNPGTIQATSEPLWDSAVYPTAGTNKLTFFTVPQNQLIQNPTANPWNKSTADTNLTTAGMLSNGQLFLTQTIELHVFPGVTTGGEGEAENAPKQLDYTDDILSIVQYGWMELWSQNSTLIQRVPLLLAPPSTRMAGFAALSDSTTAAASQRTSIAYAALAGQVADIVPFTVEPNTAFRVDIIFNKNGTGSGAATPSGQDALLRCYLGGFFYRNQ